MGIHLHQQLMGNEVFFRRQANKVGWVVPAAHTTRDNMMALGISVKNTAPSALDQAIVMGGIVHPLSQIIGDKVHPSGQSPTFDSANSK